jgi:hypothetical protein
MNKGITPEFADKVLEADAALAAKKINEGKGMTSSQRAYYLSVSGKSNIPANGLANNHVELARILNVSRSSVVKWARQEGAPKPKPNGNHDISEWLLFIKEHGLKGAEEEGEGDLKRRRLLAQCLKIEAELDIIRGNWLPKALVDRYMQDIFTACRSKILQSPLDEQATDEVLYELARLQKIEFAVRPDDNELELQLPSLAPATEVDG